MRVRDGGLDPGDAVQGASVGGGLATEGPDRPAPGAGAELLLPARVSTPAPRALSRTTHSGDLHGAGLGSGCQKAGLRTPTLQARK